MSTHSICFHGEIRKISLLLGAMLISGYFDQTELGIHFYNLPIKIKKRKKKYVSKNRIFILVD